MSRPQRANTFDQLVEEVQIALGKKKKSPGRPTVAPNIILGRRDDIAQMLEIDWGLVGWKLECLRREGKKQRSPEDVRIALEPLRGKHSAERITILLRPTSTPATSDEVRQSFILLGRARETLQTIRTAHQEQVTSFKDVWKAYYETSGKYRQELKIEITRRIGNMVQLRKRCAEKERLNRTLEKQGVPQSELLNAQAQLRKSLEELRIEEEIVRGSKERLKMASNQNRSSVRQIARSRLKRLRETKTEMQRLESEVRSLEKLYEDQAAGFCRQDFLTLSIEHRARHHPRQIANALAGLPETACRQSLKTCRKIAFQRDPHPNFKVFEVIARVWNKSKKEPQPISALIKAEIRRMPKTWTFNGARVPYYFREYVQTNQLLLERAIESACSLNPQPHPREIPYVATILFLESVSKQQTSTLARVLAQATSANG
jgi:hypothetical protein